MSTSHTAVSFNIPSSTLNDCVSGKTAMGAVGGPPSISLTWKSLS